MLFIFLVFSFFLERTLIAVTPQEFLQQGARNFSDGNWLSAAQKYWTAAKIFENKDLWKDAGDAYFLAAKSILKRGNDFLLMYLYDLAANSFEKAGLFELAGDVLCLSVDNCLDQQQDAPVSWTVSMKYYEAAILFEEAKAHDKMFRTLLYTTKILKQDRVCVFSYEDYPKNLRNAGLFEEAAEHYILLGRFGFCCPKLVNVSYFETAADCYIEGNSLEKALDLYNFILLFGKKDQSSEKILDIEKKITKLKKLLDPHVA